MQNLIDPRSPQAADAPEWVRIPALHEDKQILKIVWDEADGYPPHAWGYIQWTIRPYQPWYGCDGTTDQNIHLIAYHLCNSLGLDYNALYRQAYPKLRSRGVDPTSDYWREVSDQTIIPALSHDALCSMLHDLHDINNHSLANLLENILIELGHDVADYYDHRPAQNRKEPTE